MADDHGADSGVGTLRKRGPDDRAVNALVLHALGRNGKDRGLAIRLGGNIITARSGSASTNSESACIRTVLSRCAPGIGPVHWQPIDRHRDRGAPRELWMSFRPGAAGVIRPIGVPYPASSIAGGVCSSLPCSGQLRIACRQVSPPLSPLRSATDNESKAAVFMLCGIDRRARWHMMIGRTLFLPNRTMPQISLVRVPLSPCRWPAALGRRC